VLCFEDEAIVALTGAPADARIEGAPVPRGRAVFVPAGTELNVGPCTSGCRTTLAIAGGVDVAPVLDSRSTNVRAHFGGLAGRALAAGDRLPIGSASSEASHLVATLRANGLRWSADSVGLSADLVPTMGPDVSVRAIPTDAFARLDERSRKTLFSDAFIVGSRSDRMGYRLEGPALHFTDRREMISEGVAWGAMQLPPDGRPIVLGADRPTTGGYPVIAYAASADRGVMAQLRPGDRLRFAPTSLAQAEEAWKTKAHHMAVAVETLRRRRARDQQ
jgi:antagonist of KipI